MKELDHKIGAIVAKKIAGIVVKEAAGVAVEKITKNETLGALTTILLHITDQADCRSWSTLPAHLQIARLVLPAGRYDLVLDMVSGAGVQSSVHQWKGLEIKSGEISFLNYRLKD